jgi:Ca-activated chloride channel family protein
MRASFAFPPLLTLVAVVLAAQTFRVDSGLVLVRVNVTDGKGASVRGLAKESFTVLDDGRPRPISAFYSEDAPCTVGFVLDISGSMRRWLDREKEAVRAFIELANPGDEFFVTTASSSIRSLSGITADYEELDARVRALSGGGWTALYDGIQQAAEQARKGRHDCRALVVMSDGIDNHSRISKQQLLRFLMESDVQVYTIGVGAPATKGLQQIAEQQRGVGILWELACETGGIAVTGKSAPEATKRISAALRDRYVLGFQPPEQADPGKWRRIQVKLDRKAAKAYARSGYRPAVLP